MSSEEFQRDPSWRSEAGVDVYVLLAVIALVVLLLDGYTLANEIYYYYHAVQVECDIYGNTVHFEDQDGRSHFVTVDLMVAQKKNGKVRLYYIPGKEESAIVMTQLWFHPVMLILGGILLFTGVRGFVKNRDRSRKRRK